MNANPLLRRIRSNYLILASAFV